MQDRYWLYQRENGRYYVEDRHTGKQESLRTQDKAAARRMVAGKNQAVEQPCGSLLELGEELVTG